jgi:hypothetical protein
MMKTEILLETSILLNPVAAKASDHTKLWYLPVSSHALTTQNNIAIKQVLLIEVSYLNINILFPFLRYTIEWPYCFLTDRE